MEKYRYIIGQINALESVRQEIINLLNDKEDNENTGTVIDLKRDKKRYQIIFNQLGPEPVKEITSETQNNHNQQDGVC